MNSQNNRRRLPKIMTGILALTAAVGLAFIVATHTKPGKSEKLTALATANEQQHGAAEDDVKVMMVDPLQAPDGAVDIETNVMKARVSLVGGQLSHIELKKYADAMGNGDRAILLDSSPKHQFSLQTGLVEFNGALPDHHAKFEVARIANGKGGKAGEVTIRSERNDITLEKRLVFRPGSYTIGIEETITNERTTSAAPILYLQLRHDGRKPEGEGRFNSGFTGPVVFSDKGGYQKMTFNALNKGSAHHVRVADNGWFAIPQHFFVTAVLPKPGTMREIYATKVGDNAYTLGNKIALGEMRPHEARTIGTDIYAGPIDRALMTPIAKGLELTQDYSWLTAVAEPMYSMLSTAKDITGNWGWGIIAMTLFVRLLCLPMSASSHKRMAKIKLLAPQLKELREKIGDDAPAMHKATMALYRKENISLAAGCLPILVQMPIFLALYWVLQSSVALRGASWAWIHDLTQADPYYVLPLVYAASMMMTVKFNPKPVDPNNTYVAYAFPFGLSIVFAFMPAGVTLFWIVTNLTTLAQQLYFQSKQAQGGNDAITVHVAESVPANDLPGQAEKAQEPIPG